MEKLLIFSMDVCHKVFCSFWQIQNGLEIDDLRAGCRNRRVQFCHIFQIFLFEIIIHAFTPFFTFSPERNLPGLIFFDYCAAITSLMS